MENPNVNKINTNNVTFFSDFSAGVSVIIPAHNEESTIENVILCAKKSSYVSEVIVVDNCSTDKTSKLAKKLGVRVVKCNNKGKGYAMEAGFKKATNPIVVFLDADLKYTQSMLRKLIIPIIEDRADFVKSTFSRQAGRVTEILVKPLLKILYPMGIRFSQPLSGIIAGKKEFFKQIEFEKNYGVDIGLLIDMIRIGARIKEVNIGRIDNRMRDLTELSEMASQVAEVIIKKTIIEQREEKELFGV